MEGKTHFERVVGGNEKDKESARRVLQEMFEDSPKQYEKYELEKTPEDIQIIDAVVMEVDKMVADYGGDPKPLPLEKIHFLKKGAVKEMTGGEHAGGIHSTTYQNIGVEKSDSLLGTASTIAHELFHLKSYKAAAITFSPDKLHLYRTGLRMVNLKDKETTPGDKPTYFGELEEAIVAECARILLKELKKLPFFKKESEDLEKIKKLVFAYYARRGAPKETLELASEELKYVEDPEAFLENVNTSGYSGTQAEGFAAGMFDRMLKEGRAESTERLREREKMYKLFQEIVEKSDGRFKDKNEVFEKFASANFTGNYLEIARIVEGALGKGAFRRIAEEFTHHPKKT